MGQAQAADAALGFAYGETQVELGGLDHASPRRVNRMLRLSPPFRYHRMSTAPGVD